MGHQQPSHEQVGSKMIQDDDAIRNFVNGISEKDIKRTNAGQKTLLNISAYVAFLSKISILV